MDFHGVFTGLKTHGAKDVKGFLDEMLLFARWNSDIKERAAAADIEPDRAPGADLPREGRRFELIVVMHVYHEIVPLRGESPHYARVSLLVENQYAVDEPSAVQKVPRKASPKDHDLRRWEELPHVSQKGGGEHKVAYSVDPYQEDLPTILRQR